MIQRKDLLVSKLLFLTIIWLWFDKKWKIENLNTISFESLNFRIENNFSKETYITSEIEAVVPLNLSWVSFIRSEPEIGPRANEIIFESVRYIGILDIARQEEIYIYIFNVEARFKESS